MAVQVIPCDVAHLAAAIDDPAALARRIGAPIAAGVIEDEWRAAFCVARDELVRRPEIFPWWTATAIGNLLR